MRKFYCPVCESYFDEWRRFRENEEGRLCPNCDSFERTRHFKLSLTEYINLDRIGRFLHFAPEKGLRTYLKQRLGRRYLTADLYMGDVDVRADLTSLPFPCESFDFIYCSNVLEHIEDDSRAMREIFRVLKTSGEAIIQVPIREGLTYEDPRIKSKEQRLVHFGQSDHVRFYGPDIQKRLEYVGFAVQPFYMIDVLYLDYKQLIQMKLNKRELVHRCSKS